MPTVPFFIDHRALDDGETRPASCCTGRISNTADRRVLAPLQRARGRLRGKRRHRSHYRPITSAPALGPAARATGIAPVRDLDMTRSRALAASRCPGRGDRRSRQVASSSTRSSPPDGPRSPSTAPERPMAWRGSMLLPPARAPAGLRGHRLGRKRTTSPVAGGTSARRCTAVGALPRRRRGWRPGCSTGWSTPTTVPT